MVNIPAVDRFLARSEKNPSRNHQSFGDNDVRVKLSLVLSCGTWSLEGALLIGSVRIPKRHLPQDRITFRRVRTPGSLGRELQSQ